MGYGIEAVGGAGGGCILGSEDWAGANCACVIGICALDIPKKPGPPGVPDWIGRNDPLGGAAIPVLAPWRPPIPCETLTKPRAISKPGCAPVS
jgi:hypothetical protein